MLTFPLLIWYTRYEDPTMHKKFEHVRQALIEQKLEEPQKVSTRDLSIWTGQFIQFMEDFMGRDVWDS